MTENMIKNTQSILKLIEDKQYPAKRLLYDYITDLVYQFNPDICNEMEKMGKDFFAKSDKEGKE